MLIHCRAVCTASYIGVKFGKDNLLIAMIPKNKEKIYTNMEKTYLCNVIVMKGYAFKLELEMGLVFIYYLYIILSIHSWISEACVYCMYSHLGSLFTSRSRQSLFTWWSWRSRMASFSHWSSFTCCSLCIEKWVWVMLLRYILASALRKLHWTNLMDFWVIIFQSICCALNIEMFTVR